jgi:hypothetical protein
MTRIIMIAALLLLGTAANAQYGPYGPYRPYGPYGRWREPEGRMWPPTRYGPNENCWQFGDCRGPRYQEDPEQSWRRPRSRPTCFETGEC